MALCLPLDRIRRPTLVVVCACLNNSCSIVVDTLSSYSYCNTPMYEDIEFYCEECFPYYVDLAS